MQQDSKNFLKRSRISVVAGLRNLCYAAVEQSLTTDPGLRYYFITNVRYKIMPKMVDHEEYRKELLGKAFECFAARGYGQVTMRGLAEHLEVSTGTLYHYFSSKEQIFEDLVTFQADHDLRIVAELPTPPSLDKRMTILINKIVEYRSYLAKQCMVWLDFARQHGDERLFSMPSVQKAYSQYMQLLKEYLAIKDDAAAMFVYSYLCGFSTDPYVQQQNPNIEKQCQLIADAVRRYSKLK